MNLWQNTWELIKIGYNSLFKDPTGYGKVKISGVLTFAGLPLLIILGCLCLNITIQESLVSDILTVLSIFLAITLGVIFIVPDKLTKRLEADISTNESDVNSRNRYKRFCRLFIQRLSFILILSVILIILTIIMQILPSCCEVILSSLIFGFFALSILSILKLIIDIYIFLIDDIDSCS